MKGSRYCRYEGIVFEETKLVKGRSFTDDASILHECLYLLNCQKFFVVVISDGVCTWNSIFRRVRQIPRSDYYCRHFHLSVRPHGTTQLPLDSFSGNSVCLSVRMEQLSSHWTAFHEILSVCPSAWNNSAPTGRLFMKFYIWIFFESL